MELFKLFLFAVPKVLFIYSSTHTHTSSDIMKNHNLRHNMQKTFPERPTMWYVLF